MSAAVWKIGTITQPVGEASTFASLGLCHLQRSLTSAGLDQVTFEASSALALTEDLAFNYGQSYIVWKDTTPWFYGRVTTLPRQGSARAETRRVVLAGPWWYFQECTYMQSWRIYNVPSAGLTNANRCRVILFQSADGTRAASGAQVGNVVDWLITRGAPIQKGVIDSGITLPYDEQVNIKCSGVIDSVLRWTPDYVAWFDYSTTPPTFHFRKQTNLTAVSLPLMNASASGISITPRYDLQKPGVSISYEKTHSVDGQTYNTVETDTAGDVNALDCVYGVFDLQGSSQTFVSQKIVTEDFPEANDKAWWKLQVPWLAQYDDAAVDDTIDGFERFIVSGVVQDWMEKDAVKGCIRAQVDIVHHGSLEKILRDERNIVITREVVATDASTMTYRRLTSWDSGEQTPAGVAAALYSSWGLLHWEGACSSIEEECSCSIVPGRRFNLAGGRVEWSTMNALVQRTTEDVDSGSTSISFGPAAVVEADSLIALFRALRSRRYAYQSSSRTTGETSGAGEVEMSGKAADTSPSSGGGETKRLVVSNTANTLTHDVDLDPASIVFEDSPDAAPRVLKPREIWTPQLTSTSPAQLVYKRRQVMASDAYHADQLVGALIRLKELLDVAINASTLADGDALKWDATSSKWVNGEVAGSGGDPEDPGTGVVTMGADYATENGDQAEDSEEELQDTWQAGNEGGLGLAEWHVTRVVYCHDSAKILYAFVRLHTYDKFGRLYSVSAETRVSVDETVEEQS